LIYYYLVECLGLFFGHLVQERVEESNRRLMGGQEVLIQQGNKGGDGWS